LKGPAELVIRSETAATMAHGALGATVPRQAVGFEVATPLGQLVDLGTEFTARLHADNSLEIHVFSGLVEVQLPDAGGRINQAPLRIAEGAAIKIDGRSRKVESVFYDVTQRITNP
jgi:ferric-dicitrate binding protein FerR (iron transport regulator)